MEWKSATKQEALTAIDTSWVGIDPALRARLSAYLIDPQPASVERFGKVENAFIVARIGEHVVFFDDVEEDFGTALEADGMLSEVAALGNIALALRELERVAAGHK